MKKKVLAVTALASCIALTATFTGCSLVTVDNKADMEQVVAKVDISKQTDRIKADAVYGDLTDYVKAVGETSVTKRDLVSLFLNYGYSSISQGSTYEETINSLLDMLIENEILVQYSTVALLYDKATNQNSEVGYDKDALDTYLSKTTGVEKYEYLLGGKDSEDVKLAQYKLYSSLNSAIDNYEKTIIEEENDYSGSATRATPKNLNTEQDNYYPQDKDGNLDYNIYTGYKGYLLSDSGVYQDDALDNTNRATRIKAYNTFIYRLYKNNLIDAKAEAANLKDIWKLEYVQSEYVTQLESRIINKYYDAYEAYKEEALKDDGYAYIQSLYEQLLNGQKDDYSSSAAFESAMGNMSSSSFLLYSPNTDDSDLFDGKNHGKFGYVYNILLPFNAKQNAELSSLKTILGQDEDENYYYNERNKLLAEIKTEDQRAAWFNGSTNYSFNAEEKSISYYDNGKNSSYLFFEGNLTDNVRYKQLEAYDGRYPYNGQVYENEDGSYTLIGNELTIDGMLDEFSAYIKYVSGANVDLDKNNSYYGDYGVDYKTGNKNEIDYSKFLYASGMVNFDENFNRANLLYSETQQYKAMSAVNELQFAYTTDTGVLSQYIGYSVSAYDTNYIKEFEYAAKNAISRGAGSFAVCAGDYGWHLIYVTFAFDEGNTYGEKPDWENNIGKEGTFENLFYETVKGNDLNDLTSTHRSKIVSDFNQESTVTKFEKTYKNLIDLDNN